MDILSEDEISQLATDYTQEDLDYNKLNEWLQTQTGKGNSLFG